MQSLIVTCRLHGIDPYALALIRADPQRLAAELSLDENKARDQAWDALAAQRDAEIEDGQIAEIDGTEALARLRFKHG